MDEKEIEKYYEMKRIEAKAYYDEKEERQRKKDEIESKKKKRELTFYIFEWLVVLALIYYLLYTIRIKFF